MSTSKTATPARLLAQVAGERQTGALVVGGHPGGAVYVLEGQVIYAESPAAPGVGELLTSSGRLAGRTWQSALDQGTSTAQVGRLLVEQGHLTQGELELCVLGATYDAAYFALAPPSAPVDFLAGATHWLGPVVHVDPAAVAREVRRRVRLLDEIFPDARVDTAAVTPVTRPPRERVTLTAPQWELLVHADGQRTPADLALLLGRAGYATVQELRRLAAAGLLELSAVRAESPEFVRLPRARGTAVPSRRPVVAPAAPAAGSPQAAHAAPAAGSAQAAPAAGSAQAAPAGGAAQAAPAVPVVPAPSPAPAPTPARAPAPGEEVGANGTVYRPPRLARRKPGAKLPKEVAGETPPAHPGTDEVLLKRIRTALRALR
ncbi:DUF4388 domain-containing protein [Actinoplanes sp. CA-030573]|uniref:DUF4388 domain-containing protein n=1 Tax=Actinoplanes sp. CA-030573 TaxID=3239898 RepID=UPI003D91BE84